MDETTLDAYFARLAVPRPHTADAVNLHVLHRAHQMTVPFENLRSTWASRSCWPSTT